VFFDQHHRTPVQSSTGVGPPKTSSKTWTRFLAGSNANIGMHACKGPLAMVTSSPAKFRSGNRHGVFRLKAFLQFFDDGVRHRGNSIAKMHQAVNPIGILISSRFRRDATDKKHTRKQRFKQPASRRVASPARLAIGGGTLPDRDFCAGAPPPNAHVWILSARNTKLDIRCALFIIWFQGLSVIIPLVVVVLASPPEHSSDEPPFIS